MATYDIDDVAYIESVPVYEFDYTGSVQQVTLAPGQYKMECWGAKSIYSKSSPSTSYAAGYGGYARGTLNLQTTTTFYLYVGGTPITTYNTRGGYNGGGGSYSGSSYNDNAPGAGATDIALVGGECTLDSYARYVRTEASYLSRIIVAGGGGGGRATNALSNGGYGGMPYTDVSVAGRINGAGTNANGMAGSFGYGTTSTASTDDSPGGGGGWYGGGNVTDNYGGGGSSFVYCDDTVSYLPSNYSPTSDFKMTDVTCIAGGTSMIEPDGTTSTGHIGNGYIRITQLDYTPVEPVPAPLLKDDIINCDYKGENKCIYLPIGSYQLECWGAQGGNYSTQIFGGKGGYSEGILTLIEPTFVYVYTGGAGSAVTTYGSMAGGGFNGGGNAYTTASGSLPCGGGGASDIRMGQDSIYARVITAGGGGGAGSYSTLTTGGYGGGLTGEDAYDYSTSYLGGNGGTQTAAGTSYYGTTANSTFYFNIADFGNGGSAKNGSYVTGGGGGWYGGGGSRNSGGGGGSGYVYTESTASNYPSGCLLTSDYYLTDASTIGGNQSITEPDGTSATGHSGNGYIRITVLAISGGINGRVKIGGTWNNISNMYVKVNNVWNNVTGAYIKKNGAWLPI